MEKFDEDGNLTYKLISDYVRWDSSRSKWSIQNYFERFISDSTEVVRNGLVKDTTLPVSAKTFKTRESEVESYDLYELNKAIKQERFMGSKVATYYEFEKHKRLAFPFATFILTLMGVSIASRKVRGGIGIHIGAGIGLSFAYILFLQVSQTFATKGNLDPIIAAWIPNMVFAVVAVYLYRRTPK